jgi:nucleoside-diphosphate-sugar epimerase
VIGTLNLCDVAFMHNIHVTNFATGCIFEYDEKHPLGSGVGFTEDDEPNFGASFYSKTKGIVEKLLRFYPNVLTLRVRMPISDDLSPRSFITKISKYAKVVNVPNSMTVLHDLLPVAIDMTEKGLLGVINFTNPGAISHNEILDLYKKVCHFTLYPPTNIS